MKFLLRIVFYFFVGGVFSFISSGHMWESDQFVTVGFDKIGFDLNYWSSLRNQVDLNNYSVVRQNPFFDVVIVTEEKKDQSFIGELSTKSHQFVILQSQTELFITPGSHRFLSINQYIQNSLDSNWNISSAKDIFKKCQSMNISNNEPLMVFQNLLIYCNKFQLKSSSGKLLSRIYYPKKHQLKGIYIYCHNSSFSHYFFSHNNSSFENHRLSKIPFSSHFSQKMVAPSQWNYESIPIIIPSKTIDTMSGFKNYNQVIFIPFSRDESHPIIIPSVEQSRLVHSCEY